MNDSEQTGKNKNTEVAILPEEIKARELANDYIALNKIGDFALVPSYTKLTLLQKTPKQYIKTRKVGKAMVPYIEHEFAEKALNFVFNFKVSAEILDSKFIETMEDYMDWNTEKDAEGNAKPRKSQRKVTEAEAMVKFTFTIQDGTQIVRTVYSSHKGFPNPATTRGDIMKSAISKAWTVVARTFGIGADLKMREESAYKKADREQGKYQPPVQKSFSPNY